MAVGIVNWLEAAMHACRFRFQNHDRGASLVGETKPTVVALDLSAVPDLECTALKVLIESEKRQREHGVKVWLVGMHSQVLEGSG